MSDNLPHKQRVLVCPLNWGLGHASRCIPVIRKLQNAGYEVLIAADGRARSLLQSEFPEIITIRLPGFSPRFSSGSRLIWNIISWGPSLAWHTLLEHNAIKRLVKEHEIAVVISDNRFGLYTSTVKSIFITHQVMFKIPVFLSFCEPILYHINKFFIEKYDSCWIPDLPGTDNLSGDLSHKYPLPGNAHFIGLLSRFSHNSPARSETSGPLLAVLSGPEPQRSIFERAILDQLVEMNQEAVVVRGTPENNKEPTIKSHVTILASLSSGGLSEAISIAGMVICRSGYSSLMDLVVLGKKEVLLVPTPGQTEQEYLAGRALSSGWFITEQQQNLNLRKSLSDINICKGKTIPTGESLLDEQITLLNTFCKASQKTH